MQISPRKSSFFVYPFDFSSGCSYDFPSLSSASSLQQTGLDPRLGAERSGQCSAEQRLTPSVNSVGVLVCERWFWQLGKSELFAKL